MSFTPAQRSQWLMREDTFVDRAERGVGQYVWTAYSGKYFNVMGRRWWGREFEAATKWEAIDAAITAEREQQT